MTGLDKIIAEIQQEAQREADAALEKANAQAAEILADAKTEADAVTLKINAQAEKDVRDIAAARESALTLQRRQRTLEVKQEMLGETLQKALESLYSLPENEYFALLTKLAAAAAQPGAGEMLLNEADLKRAPASFKAGLAAALPAGSTLVVSAQTRPIDGGFVLKYGDIEENCSFKAMFDARQDEFSDLIRDKLFG